MRCNAQFATLFQRESIYKCRFCGVDVYFATCIDHILFQCNIAETFDIDGSTGFNFKGMVRI